MRLRRLAVAAALAAVAAYPAPAGALTYEAGAVTGSGAVSPPATAVPRPSYVTFTGTISLLGAPQACSMSGPAAFESMEAGAGAISGTCGGATMACLYERAGVAVTWECTTATTGALAGVFLYRPLNVNPTTLFDLTGVLAGVTSV